MISKNTTHKDQDEENHGATEKREKLSQDVIVISQEVKIVKALASNDLNQRMKQLKKLRRWLTLRSNSSFPFTEEDFLRIWKGLYYMMWLSDKPLVQEELAEDLSKLVECFSDIKAGIQFFGAFLKTMCREWFGIDQWRMDKFLMLIRRMVRYMFHALRKDGWIASSIKEFNTHIFETVLAESTCGGIAMHFMDVFFDELAKVSNGELTAKTVGQFVKPFVKFMSQQHDFKILGHCRNRVFNHLLYQSELGREYSEKYNAWKEMGFPTESIHDLEKVEAASDTEEEEGQVPTEYDSETQETQSKPLDPRAGNVDVFVPILPLDGKYVVKEIESLLYQEETSIRSRKILKDILEKYQTYQSGKFPLGVQTMPKPNLKSEKPLIATKVQALEELESNIYSTSRKLKQLSKRKRKKLLASMNFTEADEETFEGMIERSIPKVIQNGSKPKKRKSSQSMRWLEEEADDISPSKASKTDEEPEPTPDSTKEEMTASEAESTFEIEAVEKVSSTSEWDEPLQDGEIEYFIPSVKNRLKEANDSLTDLVPNPFAFKLLKNKKNQLLGKKTKKQIQNTKIAPISSPYTPAKRVKIVLTRNTVQKPSEYIKQIKSSPNLPYDAEKKPLKGLLKPNSTPSPINPFYKKKIGLKLLNDTL